MINTRTEATTLIIELPTRLDTPFGDQFGTECKEWLIRPVDQFALDFKLTTSVKATVYRPLLAFARLAKTADKKVVSLNLKPELAAQLKGEGVLGLLNPVTGLPAQTAKVPRLDVTMINPFVFAVVHTLKVRANTEIHPGKPFVAKGSEHKPAHSIALTGLIEVLTSAFTGVITLSFTESVIKSLRANMHGQNPTGSTANLRDVTGELLNMIYDAAKTRLNELPGFELQSARPTVIEDARPVSPRETVLTLPFSSPAGDFQLEIVWLR